MELISSGGLTFGALEAPMRSLVIEWCMMRLVVLMQNLLVSSLTEIGIGDMLDQKIW